MAYSYDQMTTALGKNVSRETFTRLERYAAHLLKWNPKINLVAKTTDAAELWERHIRDSLQLADHIPTHHRVLDLGSGGGLPGFVLACLGCDVTMVESDQRKCIFLEEAARICELPAARILNQRAEALAPEPYDTVTARALASLDQLLGYAQPHLGISSQCLFPKGERYRMEIEEARGHWQFDACEYPSLTNRNSVIIQITNLRQPA